MLLGQGFYVVGGDIYCVDLFQCVYVDVQCCWFEVVEIVEWVLVGQVFFYQVLQVVVCGGVVGVGVLGYFVEGQFVFGVGQGFQEVCGDGY